ncbi:interferon regulatory factor 2-binding protein 1 [Sarcophilus harrisii]|uniref:interferon regulatory factor 2-binding protein 1 n=1 Tax=Sarcophilus harrisii TaxID=9305 RepID=UPI001301EEE8|nr:interferon regulatory factor 2-binding protein 1 [Sarcophilus harrisii]
MEGARPLGPVGPGLPSSRRRTTGWWAEVCQPPPPGQFELKFHSTPAARTPTRPWPGPQMFPTTPEPGKAGLPGLGPDPPTGPNGDPGPAPEGGPPAGGGGRRDQQEHSSSAQQQRPLGAPTPGVAQGPSPLPWGVAEGLGQSPKEGGGGGPGRAGGASPAASSPAAPQRLVARNGEAEGESGSGGVAGAGGGSSGAGAPLCCTLCRERLEDTHFVQCPGRASPASLLREFINQGPVRHAPGQPRVQAPGPRGDCHHPGEHQGKKERTQTAPLLPHVLPGGFGIRTLQQNSFWALPHPSLSPLGLSQAGGRTREPPNFSYSCQPWFPAPGRASPEQTPQDPFRPRHRPCRPSSFSAGPIPSLLPLEGPPA